jgi:hypothetical protein
MKNNVKQFIYEIIQNVKQVVKHDSKAHIRGDR